MTNLKFKGSELPERLENALGWFSNHVLSYDVTDKGLALEFTMVISERQLKVIAHRVSVMDALLLGAGSKYFTESIDGIIYVQGESS